MICTVRYLFHVQYIYSLNVLFFSFRILPVIASSNSCCANKPFHYLFSFSLSFNDNVLFFRNNTFRNGRKSRRKQLKWLLCHISRVGPCLSLFRIKNGRLLKDTWGKDVASWRDQKEHLVSCANIGRQTEANRPRKKAFSNEVSTQESGMSGKNYFTCDI